MRLGDFININPESIQKGYQFEEIEYIDISSMGTGILQGTQRLQISSAPSRARRIVRNGDTLLATVRPNLRSFWFARYTQENTIASTGFAVLRAGKDVNERYLYFLVTNQSFTDYLTANAKGAAYPAVDTDTIERAEVFIPPLPTQLKIAALLSAYDDLIENNVRRIKILEEMAQNLYREWFVKFRFPGHERARFVDSPLGKIPEGWEVAGYCDLIDSSLGGDWGVDEPDENENVPILVIRGTDFSDIEKGSPLRTPKRYITPSSLSKRQLRAGDLLVENSINAKSRCIGTTLLITDGILHRLSDPAIAASFCKVYRFKDPSIAPLAYLHMHHLYKEGKMAFYQNVAANGIGNFQSQRFLESERLTFPSDPQRRYELLTFLTDLSNSTLADQVFTLRLTRDLLLPKLISGEVDVSELDIAIPEEVDL